MGFRQLKIPALIMLFAAFSIVTLLFLSSPTGKVVWMNEGDELNILFTSEGQSKLSLVRLFDVAGSNNRTKLCGFLVDGEHIWIEEGQDNVMKGLRIYVRKVILVRDQLQDKDICKVAFAGTIIRINESSSDEEIVMENLSYEEDNTSRTSEENGVSVEVLGEVEGEEEIDIVEEKPAKTGLFQRIVLWLKSVF